MLIENGMTVVPGGCAGDNSVMYGLRSMDVSGGVRLQLNTDCSLTVTYYRDPELRLGLDSAGWMVTSTIYDTGISEDHTWLTGHFGNRIGCTHPPLAYDTNIYGRYYPHPMDPASFYYENCDVYWVKRFLDQEGGHVDLYSGMGIDGRPFCYIRWDSQEYVWPNPPVGSRTPYEECTWDNHVEFYDISESHLAVVPAGATAHIPVPVL